MSNNDMVKACPDFGVNQICEFETSFLRGIDYRCWVTSEDIHNIKEKYKDALVCFSPVETPSCYFQPRALPLHRLNGRNNS